MSLATKLAVGFLAATVPVLAACSHSFSVGTDDGKVSASAGPMAVDKDLLSAEVQAQLTKRLGHPSSPIDCPAGIAPFTGETTTCLMSAPDGTYDVTVTVSKVDWTGFGNFGVGNASFDIKVADKPNA